MCEILIKWGDKVPPGDPLYSQNYRDGDIIALVPDGWVWTTRELTNPAWRIVKLPNVTVTQASYLTAAAFDPITGNLTGKRTDFINTTLVPQNVFNQINRNQVSTFQITYADLSAWITKH